MCSHSVFFFFLIINTHTHTNTTNEIASHSNWQVPVLVFGDASANCSRWRDANILQKLGQTEFPELEKTAL